MSYYKLWKTQAKQDETSQDFVFSTQSANNAKSISMSLHHDSVYSQVPL